MNERVLVVEDDLRRKGSDALEFLYATHTPWLLKELKTFFLVQFSVTELHTGEKAPQNE